MSRRRYVYRANADGVVEAVEVSQDYQRHEERQPVFTDRHLEGMRAPDGTDISCRWKRNEYMRREGVADFSDYAQSFQKAQEKREAWRSGKAEVSRETVEQVGRIAHQLRGGKRR